MRYHLSIFTECIGLILCWYAHLKNCCEINVATEIMMWQIHDDVIKWKHFPRNWPFVRWIHRWPMNSPHKGQWRGALVLSWICVWINGWINNRVAGDLRRYLAHYDVIIMKKAGVGCCFLLKLEYYSSENLLKFISNKILISNAWFLP